MPSSIWNTRPLMLMDFFLFPSVKEALGVSFVIAGSLRTAKDGFTTTIAKDAYTSVQCIVRVKYSLTLWAGTLKFWTYTYYWISSRKLKSSCNCLSPFIRGPDTESVKQKKGVKSLPLKKAKFGRSHVYYLLLSWRHSEVHGKDYACPLPSFGEKLSTLELEIKKMDAVKSFNLRLVFCV